MSPGAVPRGRLVILTAAGARSRREWKRQMSPFTRPAALIPRYGTVPAGVAIVYWKFPLLAPVIDIDVLTVTVSPGLNGVEGRKLPPLPSESASIVPVWI